MVRLTLQRDHKGHVVLIRVDGDQWHVLARSSYPTNHDPTLYRRWLREVRRLTA